MKPKRVINGNARRSAKYVPMSKLLKKVQATNSNAVVHIRKHHDCQTRNIIYLIQCKKCRWAQYIGETKESPETRFSQICQMLEGTKTLPVVNISVHQDIQHLIQKSWYLRRSIKKKLSSEKRGNIGLGQNRVKSNNFLFLIHI